MSETAQRGATILRWWPIPLAAGIGAYGILVPEPHFVGSAVADTVAFVVAALLLVASSVYPSRTWRLTALWWTAVVALGRASVLAFSAPVLDWNRVVAGIIVWLTFAYLVTVLTYLTLSAGPQETQPWRS